MNLTELCEWHLKELDALDVSPADRALCGYFVDEAARLAAATSSPAFRAVHVATQAGFLVECVRAVTTSEARAATPERLERLARVLRFACAFSDAAHRATIAPEAGK